MSRTTTRPWALAIISVVACILPAAVLGNCPAGRYFANNRCYNCPGGKYQPNNFYTDRTCFDCDPGYYQNQGGRSSCKICPEGYFNSAKGQTYCLSCRPGTYNDQKGQETCKACEPGWYQNQVRQTSCKQCPAGRYSSSRGASGCPACDPGKFQTQSTQTECDNCPSGKYQHQGGRNFCIDCPKGHYMPFDGRTACLRCDPGKYAPQNGMAQCRDCDAGYYSSSSGWSSCRICPRGTYQPNEGRSGCPSCPEGTYSSQDGATECTSCPPGYYNDQTRRNSCFGCQRGKYSDEPMQRACKQCEPGKYQPQTYQSSCLTCPSGTYQNQFGYHYCHTARGCPAGYYIREVATPSENTKCGGCQPGEYQNENNQYSCKECPSGYYQDQLYQRGCKQWRTSCAAGEEIVVDRSPSTDRLCLACQDGKYSVFPNTPSCTNATVCTPGLYMVTQATQTSDRACDFCPQGKYTDEANLPTCIECDGFDFYQDQGGQPKCKRTTKCVDGQFEVVAPTSTSDRSCDSCDFPREYQDEPNQKTCKPVTPCDIGTYQTAPATPSSNTECPSCDGVLEFQDEPDQTSCKKTTLCPAGYGTLIQATPKSNRLCQVCEEGKFNDELGTEPCRDHRVCGPGEEEVTEPSFTNDRECRTCPDETFKSLPGQDTTCEAATQCSQFQWEVLALTPSSDRKCIDVRECRNRRYTDDGSDCSCPGEACQSCTFQDDYDGYLQIKQNARVSGDAVDPTNPCIQLEITDEFADIASVCADECRAVEDDACLAFFIFTTGELRGRCCLLGAFDADQLSEAEGIDSYQLDQCTTCSPGSFKKGRTCQVDAKPPTIAPHPAVLTVASTIDVGEEVVSISATAEPGYAPIEYSLAILGTNDELFEIDGQGTVTVANELNILGEVVLVIKARDARNECAFLNVNGVLQVYQGGCISETRVTLRIAGFLECPEDVFHYMPPGVFEEEVMVAQPSLPNLFTAVAISNNLPGDNRFQAGVYDIVFESDNLDRGGSVVCAFKLYVQNGYEFKTSAIGHLFSGASSNDFLLDDSVSDVVTPMPSFRQNLRLQSLAIGVASPLSKPFTVNVKPGFEGRMIVQLQMCSPGSEHLLSDTSSFLSLSIQASVKMAGSGETITLSDTGSGISNDGECVLVRLQSKKLRGFATFSRVDVRFQLDASVFRRSLWTNEITEYVPVPSNAVFFRFQHQDSSTILSDPGLMLTLEDTIAPEWVGCPVEPVQAVAPSGAVSTPVSWPEPTAFDNVQIVSQTVSPPLGTNFSIIDSPHTVTYTASDGTQSATCSFQVVVSYEPVTLDIEYGIQHVQFTGSSRDLGFLGLTELSMSLLRPGIDTVAFTDDLSNYTQIDFVVRIANRNRAVLRPLEGAKYTRFRLDLGWITSSMDEDDLELLLSQDDVRVDIEFLGYQDAEQPVFRRRSTAEPITLGPKPSMFVRLTHIDGQQGVVAVEALSNSFDLGISFEGIVVHMSYPGGRRSSVQQTFSLANATSFIGFDCVYETNELPAAPSELMDFLVLLDEEPPTFLTCPKDRNATISMQNGTFPDLNASLVLNNAVSVTWPTPLVIDNRPDISLTSNHQPGDMFAIRPPSSGPHTVLYTATDAFGNAAECSFEVTVADAIPPVMVPKADLSFVLPEGLGRYSVPYSVYGPFVFDNSNLTVSVTPTSTQQLTVGTHTINFVATDAWGNAVTGSTDITIVDEEDPVVECPENSTVPLPAGADDVAIRWDTPEISDNDQIDKVVPSHQPGDRFLPGRTLVNYTVYDRSGNMDRCFFTVYVQKDEVKAPEASTEVIAGASAGGFFLLVILLLAAVVLRRIHQEHRKPQDWNDIFKLIDQFKGSEMVKEPREIPRSAVKLLNELGKGAFGIVYKGLLKESVSMPGYLVAVKSLHTTAGMSERTELLEEAAIMAQFSHRNVVQLIGVVTVGKPMLVLLEFCEYGSLKTYLEKNEVDEVDRRRFALDCAKGLAYIHKAGFVHRDVAARNVLVDSAKTCKIADFGLARDTQEDTYYRSRGGQLPVRWSAPEALEEQKFDESTDVWSYGILMWEIWTRASLPYEGWHNQRVWVEVAAGYRMPCPDTCVEPVYELMLSCWDETPMLRPRFAMLVDSLKELYTDEAGEDDQGYLAMNADDESLEGDSRRGSRTSFFKKKSKSRLVPNPNYKDEDAVLYDMGGVGGQVAGGTRKDMSDDEALYDLGGTGDQVSGGGRQHQMSDEEALYDLGGTGEQVSGGGNGGHASFDEEDEDKAIYDLGGQSDQQVSVQRRRRSSLAASAIPEDETFGFEDEGDVMDFDAIPRPDSRRSSVSSDTIKAAVQRIGVEHPSGNADIGRRVQVIGYKCLGYLRFFGKHAETGEPRCGVEMDEPVGKNSGTVKGHTYFSCGDQHGVLCVPEKVILLEEGQKAPINLTRRASVASAASRRRSSTSSIASNPEMLKQAIEELGEHPTSTADVGRRVKVIGYKAEGVLRFFGKHAVHGGPRCGVELDEPVGKNDGVVGGHTSTVPTSTVCFAYLTRSFC